MSYGTSANTIRVRYLTKLFTLPPPPPVFYLISQGGIGRGLKPITPILNIAHAGGNWHSTYTAVPHVTTSALRSIYVTTPHVCYFDLTRVPLKKLKGVEDMGVGAGVGTGVGVNVGVNVGGGGAAAAPVMEIEVIAPFLAAVNGSGDIPTSDGVLRLSARVLHGDTPLALVEAFTAWSGRMKPIPKWAAGSGAIVGYEGGTAKVRALWAKLQAAGVPTSAFWLQDWSGVRVDEVVGEKSARLWWNWEVDYQYYPGWDDMVVDMSKEGVRVLTYINPFLANNVAEGKPNARRNLWMEAQQQGFLTENASSLPYVQDSEGHNFTFSAVDLTNADARTWFKEVIKCNMLRVGSGCGGGGGGIQGDATSSNLPPLANLGWMSDFAEYVTRERRAGGELKRERGRGRMTTRDTYHMVGIQEIEPYRERDLTSNQV